MSTTAFFDVANEDPEYETFQQMNNLGIMKGYGDGNFYPEKTMTRAEALAISMRAGGRYTLGEFDPNTLFADVEPNAWYAPFVAGAVEQKILSDKNAYFRPNQAVTKAEFLAMLFRATYVNFNPYFYRTKNIATDIDPEAWYAPHFAYAKQYQIAHLPIDNMYRPNKLMSRKEVAMMTKRQLRLFHGGEVTKQFVELQA